MNQPIKAAALVLRAVTNKTRIKIIDYLRANGKTTVTKLYIGLRMEQSVVSQHLAILRKVGVLNMNRDGKFVHYSINDTRINKITDLCTDIIGAKTAVVEDD